MSTPRFTSHLPALGFAALATLASLGTVNSIANFEAAQAHADVLLAQVDPAPLQQITITGRRVQQLVITGHRARA